MAKHVKERPMKVGTVVSCAMDKTIGKKIVTYDFARLMEGSTEVKSSEFADALISNM